MKRIALSLWLLLALSVFEACSQREPLPRSAEEIRLEESCRIDSTSLRERLNLDSIEGLAGLANLSAEAWMLVDDSTGMLISGKNVNQRMYPASLTKMMTCLLALENGHPGDTVCITDDVFVTKDARVRVGDSYLLYDLVCEMMLQSDNVSAVALAKHVAGDTLAFCRMMNEKAAYLSMDSTHFANPNGMPNDSTYSTACDLLKLTRYCMRDSLFAQIVGSAFMDIQLTDKRHMPVQNTNMLLGQYNGCIGVKTGYTRKAGNCLASAATRHGITLYLILLKSKSHSSRFSESETLLDHGFRVMDTITSQVVN
jgi:D-alanyl-D-alanine carboxypeptidase